jgi:pilus assembly protein CpaC
MFKSKHMSATVTKAPAGWSRWALAGVLAAVLALPVLPVMADTMPYLRISHRAAGTNQQVSMDINKSILVDLPTNAGEVIVTQPEIANVVMRSKTRAILQALGQGATNIFFLDPAGNAIAVIDVVVSSEGNIGPALEQVINQTIPGARVRVEGVQSGSSWFSTNRVVLTGSVPSQADAATALDIAAKYTGNVNNVANVMTISGTQQVRLKVTVAEVGRDTVKQLGINLNGSISVGPINFGLQNTPSLGGASGVVTNNGFTAEGTFGGLTLDASLRALERRGALRTLAEPTLTAISGKEATFKAGGEFPVPTDFSDGTITYTFKEFGVDLKFTPTVKTGGMIGLEIDTAVSELTTEGGFTVGTVTIPATKKRQAATSVEMYEGQTLAIAGMLQDSIRQQINQLPGLGNIPILGALFRSRDFIHSQTELVILVTPYLASAGYDVAKPTDNMQVAGDAEAIFLGHLEKMYGVGRDGMRGSYNGSVGFVLD